MSTVKDILTTKGNEVLSVGPSASVKEAAVMMNERKIGSILVVEGEKFCGIFTERDILQRIVAQERDPAQTTVGEVMTKEVACCREHTTLDEARSVMRNRRIRHLPVMDENNKLCGLISIGDLNVIETYIKEMTIHFMEEYIHGEIR